MSMGWICPVCKRTNPPEAPWIPRGLNREHKVMVPSGGCPHCYGKGVIERKRW